jgi:hypothetical protein
MVIQRSMSPIVRPDETKVTKFVLVDAVGEEAAAAGIKVGDIIVANALANIVLNGGSSFRPMLKEENAALFVRDVEIHDLLVQAESGGQYVPFDSPDAAKSLGAQEEEEKAEAAE